MPKLFCPLILLLCLAPSLAGVPERPDFNFHVQPILSDRCYFCHGPDSARRKAGLRLDQREAAIAPQKSGKIAIVPGDPAKSEALARIFSHDPDEIMPPPESKLSMTDDEREILKRWIAQGAEYKRHWAFEPPQATTPPPTSDPRIRNDIDRFVAARLAQEGLQLAAEAPKETLLRRLSLDLTGLPPSVEELDAFLADDSPQAYEKQVDRLLAAPAFGERMAQDWLDVARFADTFGYQADVTMNQWPYRDWVIKAFNENLPFDQFITWQLAGDLLPNPTRDQRIATAFNRLHRQTNEGGSIEEEFRVEYVADRVQTYGLAFLGLTLECAKCHDHKYDPVSMKDFYSLFAYFNNVDESGLYSHFTDAIPTPTLTLTKPEEDQAIRNIESKIAAAEARLIAREKESLTEFETWRNSLNPTAAWSIPGRIGHFSFEKNDGGKVTNSTDEKEPGQIFDDVKFEPGKIGQAARLSGENNINFALGGNFTRDDAFSFALWLKTPDVKERAVLFHRSKAWTDAASCGYELLIENGKLSAALIHFWPGNALRVVTKEPLVPEQWTHVAWTYDGSSKAAGLKLFLNGKAAAVEIVRDSLTKDINRGGETRLIIGQRFRDRGFKNGLVDEFQIFDRQLSALEVAEVFSGTPGGKIEDSELREYFMLAVDETARQLRQDLKKLRQERSALVDRLPELMVMQEMAMPKPAFILERGSYESRGAPVEPDVPAAILPAPAGAPKNRLGLAQWTTDPKNPLTARVVINRFWQSIWGQGLVATPEDFGMQAALPTHPELLDSLARKWIDGGWNTKALLKEIVLSATYRQDSTVTPESLAKDPENRLLSRGPKVKLSAEAIRDSALFASGQLEQKIGGPSVNPDQSNRRTLYSFWKRTMPDVRMEIFDMAKREVCVARRQTTNTPLQSLTLLNEPQFLKASRTLAQNVHTKFPQDDTSTRCERLFRQILCRKPTTKELAALVSLAEEQKVEFADPARAKAFLATTGDGVDEKIPASDLAAYTLTANAIFNMDEAVHKR